MFMTAAGHGRIPVYFKRLRLRLGRRTFSARVGFCRHLGGAFNLLGRQDVFDRFRVCFDDHRGVVTFS